MNRSQRRHLGPEPKTSDMTEVNALLTKALGDLSEYLFDQDAPGEIMDALITVETHCAVSVRLMSKIPPRLIKAATTTFAIGAYMAASEGSPA